MHKVNISDDIYNKISGFKQVVECVIEEEIDMESYIQFVLDKGVDSLLNDLIGSLEQNILLDSFKILGSQYPNQVYRFIAEIMKKGASEEKRKAFKRQIGFIRDQDSEN